MTVCGALGAALLTPTAAGAAGSTNDDAYHNLGAPERNERMWGVASNTMPSDVSVPGAHDTLSVHGGNYVETKGNYGDVFKKTRNFLKANAHETYVKEYPGLFYADSVKGNGKAGIPRLGDVRGKLALAGFDNAEAGGYGIKDFNSSAEDSWNAAAPTAKWDYVKKNGNKAGFAPHEHSDGRSPVRATRPCPPHGDDSKPADP
ncbi:hypothetical protein DMA15_02615 [Streptomyces sp. WAC 01529]|nr:hypothetical protein DMA15_02615 [Streptomyces sp. WAC 01529]